jgi:hypothetical protein
MNASSRIALSALLWSRCGRGLIAASDVSVCAAMLPHGRGAETTTLTHELVANGLLVRAAERAWTLSEPAIEELSLPDRSDLSLTAEEEHQLFVALQRSAQNGTLDRAGLHAVTRRFLEEVLEGAMIPDELLENIVAMCGAHGRLTMSEDGGRYTINVTE